MRAALIDWSALRATPRRRAALAVVVAVLLAHGVGLGLLPQGPGPGWQMDALRPVQVRRVEPAQVAPALAIPAAGAEMLLAESPQDAARPRPRRAGALAVATAPAAPTATKLSVAPVVRSPSVDGTPTDALAAVTDTTNADSSATATAVAPPESTPNPGGVDVPVYATQLPPPITLRYQLQRGAASGTAELRWAPSATGYQLALDGDLLRQRVMAWASTGSFDAHGIAPERYAESRRGRERRAANFQRDAGRISYSGPQVQHALLPGAQDRLSWLLQLPAVLAANPALAKPGAQVAMLVAGTRGDAEVWTFAVLGMEDTALDGADVRRTVHLRRDPTRPYDTVADVWLDPARHHLPVRLQLRPRAGGDTTELLLLAGQNEP